eukprot:scaffold38838_cov69-Phaeocystis_antarctica.AAC.1
MKSRRLGLRPAGLSGGLSLSARSCPKLRLASANQPAKQAFRPRRGRLAASSSSLLLHTVTALSHTVTASVST